MKKILFLILLISNFVISQVQFNNDSIMMLDEIEATYHATKSLPITFHNINQNDIKLKSMGQEPSIFLTATPSITAYSDGGHNQGYSYFRLRGIDQTRINITFDGVPLNDPIDHAFYFSNFPDILNSISKIQIQRGVGTSKNGTASYAGNIELFSPTLHQNPKKEIGWGSGSFNSIRLYAIYNSGVSKNKALYARISKIYSGGFKEHSSHNSKSMFISSGLFKEKSMWKFNLLAGNQKNNLAWMPVLEQEINCNRKTNSNSPYEKDDFSQLLLQIKNLYSFSEKTSIRSSVYYILADGWWNFDLDNYYGITTPTNPLTRNGLSSNVKGLFLNYITHYKKVKFTSGLHGNLYQNDFTESVASTKEIWSQNTKYKKEISGFTKFEIKANTLLIFGDLQYRVTQFDYDGLVNFNKLKWSFINPKIGLSLKTHKNSMLYFNIGKSGREPSRYDMFQGMDVLSYLCDVDANGEIIIPEYGNSLINNTEPEYVTDFEFGVRKKDNSNTININFYYLDFNNERVLNGAIGPNGLSLTSNVEKSFRTGIELHSQTSISETIKLVNNTSFNHSKIKENSIQFEPILTPKFIFNQEIIYSLKNINLSITARYQSQAYMNFENTESLNDYIVLNGRIDYQKSDYIISLFINNISDNYYFNYGSINTDPYDGIEDGGRTYFVQAPRNFFISFKYLF